MQILKLKIKGYTMSAQWNDHNRFNQTGYSAPTIFPKKENYSNLFVFEDDLHKAESREQSHQEWLQEERYEARLEWLTEQAALKAERESNDY
jgi:hypothetical protein